MVIWCREEGRDSDAFTNACFSCQSRETSSCRTPRELSVIVIISPVVGIVAIFLLLIVCLVAGLFLDERIRMA